MKARTPAIVLGIGVATAACVAGFTTESPGAGSSGDDDGGGAGDARGLPTPPGDGGRASDADAASALLPDGATPPAGPITVQAPVSALEVPVPATIPTVQYRALVNGIEVPVAWSIDDASFGAIDASGLFTPSAGRGGAMTVTATAQGYAGKATLAVHLTIVDRDSTIPSATATSLQKGGSDDPTFLWTTPVAVNGAASVKAGAPPSTTFASSFDIVYFHFVADSIEYQDYVLGSTLAISAPRWAQIAKSATTGKASATKLSYPSGSILTAQVDGPVVETWTITP